MIGLILIMMSLAVEGKQTLTLEDLRWKNRIVLSFPTKGQNLNFDSLEDKMNERKIIFLSFGEEFKSNATGVFDQEYLKGVQKKFFPSKEKSNWVLIGLDGGVKLNKDGDPDWDFIFKTIDSMPMRQSEIRKSL